MNQSDLEFDVLFLQYLVLFCCYNDSCMRHIKSIVPMMVNNAPYAYLAFELHIWCRALFDTIC